MNSVAHDVQLENGQKTKSRVAWILSGVEYPKIDPRYDPRFRENPQNSLQ